MPKTGRHSTAKFTRPANATAYAANDAVGTAATATLAFASMLPAAGSVGERVMVTSATLAIDAASVPSGMGNFRLHLYNAAPGDIADNAAYALTGAAAAGAGGGDASYLGYIDLGTPAVVGSVLWAQVDGLNRQVHAPSGTSTLWGILQTQGAYTPASGTAFAVTLQTLALDA